jgi:hypothetical protein
MDLLTYAERTGRFAKYPQAAGQVYTLLGLCGETGELMNQLKKVIRDDGAVLTVERLGKLIDELGDVCWYATRYAEHDPVILEARTGAHMGLSFMDALTANPATATIDVIAENLFHLFSAVNAFCQSQVADAAGYGKLWGCIHNTARSLGVTVSQVLARNVEKLAARESRNTLQGSGDNR